MKSILLFIGLLLIVFGIATLAYQGFTYTSQEKIAQIGSVQVTAENEKTVRIPPIAGGLSFIAGVILLVVARGRR